MLYILEDSRGKCLEQQVPKAGMVGSGHKRIYVALTK